MMVKRAQQTLVGSCLLIGLMMPSFATQSTEDYPVIIQFSNPWDAKEMVHSTYSTLTYLNNTLKALNKYAVHSLSSGFFFEDGKFQDKKNKVTKILNKQKLNLHVFGKQVFHVDFYDNKTNKHYAIRIPALKFTEFGLLDTNISSVDNAKEALKVISQTHQKLRFLLTPQEITTPESHENLVGVNILKIKNPNSFIAISNSLEKVLMSYIEELHKLKEYADKVAFGKYTEKEMESLNTEYSFRVLQLSVELDFGGQPIQLLNIFKGNELTLNLKDNTQKVYYMPEISLATLQLENDSIYDYQSAIKTYTDLQVASNWILDWNINGQQKFSPASEGDKAAYASHFVKR